MPFPGPHLFFLSERSSYAEYPLFVCHALWHDPSRLSGIGPCSRQLSDCQKLNHVRVLKGILVDVITVGNLLLDGLDIEVVDSLDTLVKLFNFFRELVDYILNLSGLIVSIVDG